MNTPKEIKLYESRDGKTFKTRTGAENHNKKLVVIDLKEKLNMTEDEISEKLERAAKRLPAIRMLLKCEPNWTKWPLQHIKLINEDLFLEEKTTQYVMEHKSWGKDKEEILFTEKGANFADPELHCKDEYKVVKVTPINEFDKKVYYDYKYTWEERMLKKLENGEELSESEISNLTFELPIEYEEEGDNRRWSKSRLTVVDLLGNLYAIDWDEGLTENQENEFYNQPYKVRLEQEEIIVKETITKVIRE